MNDENNLSSVYDKDIEAFEAAGSGLSAGDDNNDSDDDIKRSGDADANLDAQMEKAIADVSGVRPRLVLPDYSAKDYFLNGKWDEHQREFQKTKPVYTGFAEMDAIQPLYPGFYVLGAMSSIGKTTFLHQMADQIAEQGTPVLYFSFEQSAHELFAKSISRRIRIAKDDANHSSYQLYTAIGIRAGHANNTKELAEQIDAYTQAVEDRLHIVECNMYTTVEDVLDVIEAFIEVSDEKPVVIVDYLQVIYPSETNGRIETDQRFNTDHVVTALKQYQKEHGLVLFAICSLNRTNYTAPVDMESFKESSKIEYTADAVIGLNFALIFDKDFETKKVGKTSKDTSITDKRVMLALAKKASVRDIILKTVKNRSGCASYSVYFQYEAAYDYFSKGSPIAYAIHKKQLEAEAAAEQNGSLTVDLVSDDNSEE